VRPRGCLSNKTALSTSFKLAKVAEKSWRRLDARDHLPKVVLGVKFTQPFGADPIKGRLVG
jgi:putative transposase